MNRLFKTIIMAVAFTIMWGVVTAYASTTGTFTANAHKTITASATDTENIEDSSEQYYLTVNKDSGVDTATSSQWVNKGDSVTVTATAKSGYKITGGTGSTGAMNAAKTVNVTSAINGYTLTWSSALARYGSYLGTTTSGSSSNGGSKVIVYTNINGETSYADPFSSSGSITIKPGTEVILRMVSGSYNSRILWYDHDNRRIIDIHNGSNYSLISASYTPTTSGILSFNGSSYYNSEYDSYGWEVDFYQVL